MRYELLAQPFQPELSLDLHGVSELIFGSPSEDIDWRITNMPCAIVILARSGDLIVGFKIGYAVGSKKFYSWLGGVLPQFRQQGIAHEMTVIQHAAAARRGFRSLETVTGHDNLPMIRTNQKAGFRECGRRASKYGEQVIFVKSL